MYVNLRGSSINPSISISIHSYIFYRSIHIMYSSKIININTSPYINPLMYQCINVHSCIDQSIYFIYQSIDLFIDPFYEPMQWFDIWMNQYYVINGIVSVSNGWIISHKSNPSILSDERFKFNYNFTISDIFQQRRYSTRWEVQLQLQFHDFIILQFSYLFNYKLVIYSTSIWCSTYDSTWT